MKIDLDKIQDIKDIAAPINLPDYTWMWVAGAFLLGMIVAAVFLFCKKKGFWIFKGKDDRPAWQKALSKLDELWKKKYPARGDIKTFYSELSDIIRQYLEERFAIRAPEMTTEEFLVHMKDLQVLTETQKDILKEFLYAADMVKFAKFTPNVEDAQISFDRIKQLIEATKIDSPPRDGSLPAGRQGARGGG